LAKSPSKEGGVRWILAGSEPRFRGGDNRSKRIASYDEMVLPEEHRGKK